MMNVKKKIKFLPAAKTLLRQTFIAAKFDLVPSEISNLRRKVNQIFKNDVNLIVNPSAKSLKLPTYKELDGILYDCFYTKEIKMLLLVGIF